MNFLFFQLRVIYNLHWKSKKCRNSMLNVDDPPFPCYSFRLKIHNVSNWYIYTTYTFLTQSLISCSKFCSCSQTTLIVYLKVLILPKRVAFISYIHRNIYIFKKLKRMHDILFTKIKLILFTSAIRGTYSKKICTFSYLLNIEF